MQCMCFEYELARFYRNFTPLKDVDVLFFFQMPLKTVNPWNCFSFAINDFVKLFSTWRYKFTLEI